MADQKNRLGHVFHFIHQNFVWLLLGSYVLASVAPGPALAIRGVELGEVSFLGERTRVSLPMLMLSFLLLNAGLGVRTSELRNLLRQPRFLVGGLAANIFVPVAFIIVVVQVMRLWHNPDEVQHILLGLALVAAMPIAGSSTAWTQNANGDLSLGLALVLFSTMLSPLTTPMTFDLIEPMATGEYRQAVDRLEAGDTGFLLIGCVLAPSLIGIGLRYLAGEERISAVRPALKPINSVDLLLLNYANAAVSLPHALADPDWDFLAVCLVIVVLLCVCAFAAGWLLSHLLHAGPAQRVSLMFGLGMNNNGTGLVLASLTLADYPGVLLPIIFYNLVQHLVAGSVDRLLFREREDNPQM